MNRLMLAILGEENVAEARLYARVAAVWAAALFLLAIYTAWRVS